MLQLANVTYNCTLALQQILTRQYSQTTLDCQHLNGSSNSGSSGTGPSGNGVFDKSDLQAVLYIVVTLLFYSLGIIVGIITYLKREKQEIEESKVFEQFLLSYSDRCKVYKVQEVISRLNFLNEQKRQGKYKNSTFLQRHLGNLKEIRHESAHSTMENEQAEVKKKICSRETTDCDDEDMPLSSIVAKLINAETAAAVMLAMDSENNDDDDDQDFENFESDVFCKRKLHKVPSVQSIKDYTEEPKTSARNSVASDDDENHGKTTTSERLLNQTSATSIDLEHETFTPDANIHKGCIVTSV